MNGNSLLEKFFFDNCLSPYLARAIATLGTLEEYEIIHLQDRFPRNITDIEWIKELGEEGDWVIISGDTRISRNHHEREVWKQAGLTTFFLAKGWTTQQRWDQAWRLVQWWPAIVDMSQRMQSGAAFEVPVKKGSGKFKQL